MTCYNMGEPQKKKARWKGSIIVWFHIYEMSRKDKSKETKKIKVA